MSRPAGAMRIERQLEAAQRKTRPEPQGFELLCAQIVGVAIVLGLLAFVAGLVP